jgi:hypothetical protein
LFEHKVIDADEICWPKISLIKEQVNSIETESDFAVKAFNFCICKAGAIADDKATIALMKAIVFRNNTN